MKKTKSSSIFIQEIEDCKVADSIPGVDGTYQKRVVAQQKSNLFIIEDILELTRTLQQFTITINWKLFTTDN